MYACLLYTSVDTAPAVEIDVAGSLAVLVQRVKDVATYAPIAGQLEA